MFSTIKSFGSKCKTAIAAAIGVSSLALVGAAQAATTTIDMTEVNAQLNSIIPLVSAVGQILLIIWAVKKAFRLIKM